MSLHILNLVLYLVQDVWRPNSNLSKILTIRVKTYRDQNQILFYDPKVTWLKAKLLRLGFKVSDMTPIRVSDFVNLENLGHGNTVQILDTSTS